MEKVSDYRPISLCNVFYKFISKLLEIHLHMILLKIIPPFESAFVPQRDIHDNILSAHEILSSFTKKSTKIAYMAIKLDIKKKKHMID